MNQKAEDIILKACKMFTKFGIKSVSMDDIAKGCGISKKTLYELVSDKRDLVKKVIEQEFNEKSQAPHAIDISKVNAIEALFMVYKGAVEFFKEYNLSMEYDLKKYYPDLYAFSQERRRKHLYQKLWQNMTEGKKEGFYRDDFNIDIITKLHIIKIESILVTDIFDDDDYTIVEIFKELFLYHFNAIATEKGRIAIEKKLKELGNE
jgi:AcrR family transcriptional regulator